MADLWVPESVDQRLNGGCSEFAQSASRRVADALIDVPESVDQRLNGPEFAQSVSRLTADARGIVPESIDQRLNGLRIPECAQGNNYRPADAPVLRAATVSPDISPAGR
jgi:hypothetical protein